MKKKNSYWITLGCSIIVPLYLVFWFFMILIKNENVMLISLLGGFFIIPIGIATIVCAIWFIVNALSKKISIKNYKLPIILVGVNIAFLILLFVYARFMY